MALLIDEVRRLVPAWDEVKVNFPSKDAATLEAAERELYRSKRSNDTMSDTNSGE